MSLNNRRPLKFHTDLKILKDDEVSIQFDRVHRVSARRVSSGSPNSKPQPIIVKLSSLHDKEFIKSFIKNLRKGRNLGISDDFPKEVEEMRKKLYPVLKAAKQEKRTAFFKVERLVIDGSLYRGPETIAFPSLRTFNGRIN